MSFLLCLGLLALAPSLAYAANLEIPGNGDKLSGIGVISGWKCEAEGEITVSFDGGGPVRLVYGSERGDTREECGDANNSFVAVFNWALLGDGEHTAVAYDNGVEFARNTFTVATTGEEFLTGASARLKVPNFPSPGEEAYFEWNQATQHLELSARAPLRISHICQNLGSPSQLPPSPVLLQPPPLPCERGAGFDGEYFIWFGSPDSTRQGQVCNAPRGTMKVDIEGGRISGTTRAPPHGRVRVSGGVCTEGGLFIGQWTLDNDYQGYFTGGLGYDDPMTCAKRYHAQNCTGIFDMFLVQYPD